VEFGESHQWRLLPDCSNLGDAGGKALPDCETSGFNLFKDNYHYQRTKITPDRREYPYSMLPGDKLLFELIGSLYEAAACPERWEDFLRLALERFAAERAGLTLHNDQERTAVTIWSMGFPMEAKREYDAYYGARNPLVKPYAEFLRSREEWHGLARAVVGEQEYRASEFYNDFGRKYRSYWVANGLVRNSLHEVTTLSVMRAETAPALDQQAVDLMGLLIPHLKRVFKIHRTMESLRSTADAAVSTVDALEGAVLGVNGTGEVVLTNQKAEEIIRQEDGVMLCGKRLTATTTTEAKELDDLVQSAAATGAGRGVHPGGAMLVQRRERQALRIFAVPFCSSHMLTEVSPCALIFINDPEAQPASRAAVLSGLYQLTPAECRLSDLLLEGLDLATAAERMRVTTETARFMLKRAFHKTGTHRQSELIRFLLGLPNVAAVR